MQNTPNTTIQQRSRRHAPFYHAWACAVLITLTLAAQAASPPSVSVVYSTADGAAIKGGVGIGSSGSIYFSTMGSQTTEPRVVALNSSHAVLWT